MNQQEDWNSCSSPFIQSAKGSLKCSLDRWIRLCIIEAQKTSGSSVAGGGKHLSWGLWWRNEQKESVFSLQRSTGQQHGSLLTPLLDTTRWTFCPLQRPPLARRCYMPLWQLIWGRGVCFPYLIWLYYSSLLLFTACYFSYISWETLGCRMGNFILDIPFW